MTDGKPRIDARTTAWLMRQTERIRALDLEVARLRGELATSDKVERVTQRYADKLEAKLDVARRREASLARAVGYLEAQRDDLRRALGRGSRAQIRAPLPRT